MRHAARSLILLLTVLAAGALAPAAGAAAGQESPPPESGLGIRLLEVPTSARNDPRANQYVVDSVSPGTVVRRRFEVSNGSSQAVTPKLYVGGAQISEGRFVPTESASSTGAASAPELVAWSKVTPTEAPLAPGAKATATVEIAVPKDASEGERYGAIWAELPPVATGGGISTVNRVGIRIYLDVSGGGEPPTTFRLDSFGPSLGTDGRPAVEIGTCNDGDRAIDLSGELSLTDGPGGVSAGPFSSDAPALTLAPGQCGKVVVHLRPDLPKGPWKATVTLRSGKVEKSASATITFPSTPGAVSPPVPAKPRKVTGTARGRLALLLALLLLLVVLLLLWWLWRRRREDDDSDGSSPTAPTTEPVAESEVAGTRR